MSKWLAIAGLIFGLFFLLGCQSSDVNDDTSLDASSPYPNPYPVSELDTTPTSRPESKNGVSIYPEIADNSEIYWFQAETFIMQGETTKIAILDEIRFELFLKDGRILFSEKPAEESFETVIQECGQLCADIIIDE